MMTVKECALSNFCVYVRNKFIEIFIGYNMNAAIDTDLSLENYNTITSKPNLVLTIIWGNLIWTHIYFTTGDTPVTMLDYHLKRCNPYVQG